MSLNLRSRVKFNINGNPLIPLSFEEREENQCENRALDFRVRCLPVGKLPVTIFHFPFSIFNSKPTQSPKTPIDNAFSGGGGQNSHAYWILGINRLPLSEGEGCFQCEDLSIRKQGEGSSRRVCHTALDAVSQDFGVEKKYRHCERMRSNPEKHQASSRTYKPKYIYPLSYRA